jgi:hypothetical protein
MQRRQPNPMQPRSSEVIGGKICFQFADIVGRKKAVVSSV